MHLFEIRGDCPVDGQQSVKENRIEFLKLVYRKPLGVLGKTDDPTCVDVFVQPLDIGVCMVKHIMLYFPVVDISRQYVDAASHQGIDPFPA